MLRYTIPAAVIVALCLGGCKQKADQNPPDSSSQSDNGAAKNLTPSPPEPNSANRTPPAPRQAAPDGAVSPPAPAPETKSTTPGTSGADASAVGADQRILSIFHAKDTEEIEVGKLAQERGSSAAAKQYADLLVKDHTAHDSLVEQTAKAAGVTLLDSKEVQRMLMKEAGKTAAPPDPVATLGALSGADFDRQFAQMMQQGHADLIKIVEQARPNLKDPAVKDLVEKTLPTLRHHEQMAQDLLKSP